MLKIHWMKILENKFNYLLIIQLATIISYPILHTIDLRFPITTLVLLIALAPALYVGMKIKLFLAIMLTGALAFLLHLYLGYNANVPNEKTLLFLMILYSSFLIMQLLH